MEADHLVGQCDGHESKIVNSLSYEKCISIGCLNVRGLLGKYDEIIALLNESKYDVLGLCETFLDSNVGEHEFMISGYSVVTKHRNRHGGGVLFYINETVKFEVIDTDVSNSVESIWIKIKCKEIDLAVGVMYRPPSANQAYYNDILDQLDYIHARFQHVVLLGDLIIMIINLIFLFVTAPFITLKQCII